MSAAVIQIEGIRLETAVVPESIAAEAVGQLRDRVGGDLSDFTVFVAAVPRPATFAQMCTAFARADREQGA